MMLPFEFDDNENALLFNTTIFPLKRKVNAKLFALFEHIKQQLKDTPEHKQFNFPPFTDADAGKISQGENYLGYPWVMLDFPRRFSNSDTFAWRTLFWYGHYFSVSLVIAGESLDRFLPLVLERCEQLKGLPLMVSISDDAWEHALDAGSYVSLDSLTAEQLGTQAREKGFIKIACKLEGSDAAHITAQVVDLYTLLLQLLS